MKVSSFNGTLFKERTPVSPLTSFPFKSAGKLGCEITLCLITFTVKLSMILTMIEVPPTSTFTSGRRISMLWLSRTCSLHLVLENATLSAAPETELLFFAAAFPFLPCLGSKKGFLMSSSFTLKMTSNGWISDQSETNWILISSKTSSKLMDDFSFLTDGELSGAS